VTLHICLGQVHQIHLEGVFQYTNRSAQPIEIRGWMSTQPTLHHLPATQMPHKTSVHMRQQGKFYPHWSALISEWSDT
jgi:hypothetical protein